jgi:hypothetical protein
LTQGPRHLIPLPRQRRNDSSARGNAPGNRSKQILRPEGAKLGASIPPVRMQFYVRSQKSRHAVGHILEMRRWSGANSPLCSVAPRHSPITSSVIPGSHPSVRPCRTCPPHMSNLKCRIFRCDPIPFSPFRANDHGYGPVPGALPRAEELRPFGPECSLCRCVVLSYGIRDLVATFQCGGKGATRRTHCLRPNAILLPLTEGSPRRRRRLGEAMERSGFAALEQVGRWCAE